ncbi:hypothetical protein B484DRAFT_453618 [Ochromonadaceae sp. CCMP2298]|nr:hypothetical protein B484DRAFT_453618 [Ochromonadaceae sp. CCMP2298]
MDAETELDGAPQPTLNDPRTKTLRGQDKSWISLRLEQLGPARDQPLPEGLANKVRNDFFLRLEGAGRKCSVNEVKKIFAGEPLTEDQRKREQLRGDKVHAKRRRVDNQQAADQLLEDTRDRQAELLDDYEGLFELGDSVLQRKQYKESTAGLVELGELFCALEDCDEKLAAELAWDQAFAMRTKVEGLLIKLAFEVPQEQWAMDFLSKFTFSATGPRRKAMGVQGGAMHRGRFGPRLKVRMHTAESIRGGKTGVWRSLVRNTQGLTEKLFHCTDLALEFTKRRRDLTLGIVSGSSSGSSTPVVVPAPALLLDHDPEIAALAQQLVQLIKQKRRAAGALVPERAAAVAYIAVPGHSKERFATLEATANRSSGGILAPIFHAMHCTLPEEETENAPHKYKLFDSVPPELRVPAAATVPAAGTADNSGADGSDVDLNLLFEST